MVTGVTVTLRHLEETTGGILTDSKGLDFEQLGLLEAHSECAHRGMSCKPIRDALAWTPFSPVPITRTPFSPVPITRTPFSPVPITE